MPTRSDRDVPRRRTADDAGVQVHFITSATLHATGVIEVTTRGSSKPSKLRSLPGPAGVQLTRSLVDHLFINGGTWTSFRTLENLHKGARSFLRALSTRHGITDLLDPDLTPAGVWDSILICSTSGGHRRNLRTFLADTFAKVRIDGDAYQAFLLAHVLPVDEYELEGYAPEVATAIEKVARKHVFAWYVEHRSAVGRTLGSLPKDWMWVPAEDLNTGDRCPPQYRVSRAQLAAAMTLATLADDKGPNLSVIQSMTADSLERASNDTAFVGSVKARNKEVTRTPADAGSLFSYGGLIEFVTAATRVERSTRDDGSDFGRLLFVATGDPTVMDGARVREWWRSTVSDWPGANVERPESITFPRLRKAAGLRGKGADRFIIGQRSATRRLYLADALPDALLIPGIVNTQTDVTAFWREEMTIRGDESVEAVDELKGKQVMDVGVAICSSNGQSPTDETKPCGLGPVACFVCTNGYRPPEVIPGLLAAVEFTDHIRDHSPKEWLEGEGPALNHLSKQALSQFPTAAVAAVPREAVHNARALIACAYLETRSLD